MINTNKKYVADFLNELSQAKIDEQIMSILKTYLDGNIELKASSPFKPMQGCEEWISGLWGPLLKSFPDLQIQPYILMGGEYKETSCVSTTGNIIGTFSQDWLEIPKTDQPMWIRYAAHFVIENGKISKAWFFFDMLDVLRQAGFNFFPNRAIECVPPGPMTGDGVSLQDSDPKESKKSLELTANMLDGLGSYDGKSLESMGQERFWHEEKMMWYGPSGIGTTRGLKGFQKYHQVPFITAFPDRGITEKTDATQFAQFADGNYSCDFGFPAMYGTHLGDGWLGLKASGIKCYPRVVDFWRREGNKLVENWVFIDMIDMLGQLGIDVFEKLKNHRNG
ncbi:MAG: ester cyclase [Reichenbachiella sp.]|uniref:ester cyclase n=1 Tax=Reichenbachiella sp. TaxID=2184521 RepID=UPI003264CE0C